LTWGPQIGYCNVYNVLPYFWDPGTLHCPFLGSWDSGSHTQMIYCTCVCMRLQRFICHTLRERIVDLLWRCAQKWLVGESIIDNIVGSLVLRPTCSRHLNDSRKLSLHSIHCNVLQWVAVWCSVLQCARAQGSGVLQSHAFCRLRKSKFAWFAASYCTTLHHTASHCITLQNQIFEWSASLICHSTSPICAYWSFWLSLLIFLPLSFSLLFSPSLSRSLARKTDKLFFLTYLCRLIRKEKLW